MAKTILKTLIKARARISDIEDWSALQSVYETWQIYRTAKGRVSLPIKSKTQTIYDSSRDLVESTGVLLDGNPTPPDCLSFRELHAYDLCCYDLAIEMAAGAEV